MGVVAPILGAAGLVAGIAGAGISAAGQAEAGQAQAEAAAYQATVVRIMPRSRRVMRGSTFKPAKRPRLIRV